MNRMMFLGLTILFLVLVVFEGCATIPLKPLSPSDGPDLIGKWRGERHGGSSGSSYTHPVELEITNENFGGEITFHGTASGTVSYPFHGKVEDGKLVCYWGSGRWVKLNFHKGDGKFKLKGDYQWMQWGGTLSLRKVTK